MAIEHEDAVAANIHVIGYVQTTDPGAIGAGKVWIDTTLGTGNWLTKIRNAANTDWETAGGYKVHLEGGTDTDHSISTADTDEWHTTTHTVADVNDGDVVEIAVNASCFAEYLTGHSDFFYFKCRISLDDGSTWTTFDNWGKIGTMYRCPMTISAFKSGTVDTSLQVQFGFREATTTNLDFKNIHYNFITKVME